jgi:hypothetical protein
MKSGFSKTNLFYFPKQKPDNYHITFKKCRNEFSRYYNN